MLGTRGTMTAISLKLTACCFTGLFLLVPAAYAQSISGMNAPINQVEAIEGHLQQSRAQASREAEEKARKKPRTYELPQPPANTQARKQSRTDGENGKPKAPVGSDSGYGQAR